MRVVSYRYGLTGARFDEIWQFTSADGGATFDAGHPVGIAPFDEAVRGPGDTLSVTTNAESTGLAVQNVPLDGSTAGTSEAILSADHPYNGTVGLAGPGDSSRSSPTARATRRCARSAGALNDAAAWTPPVDIGYADYPRLAGGPSGLFLLSGTPDQRARRAQVERQHLRRRREDRRRRRRRPGAPHAGPRRAPARRLRPRHGGRAASSTTRPPTTAARWQSGPLLTRPAPIRASAACARRPPPTISASRRGRPRRAPRRRCASSASGPRAASRRRCPASRWPSACVSGKVFITSASGQAHAADGRRDDPRRQPDRHAQGPRRADLGGDRHRHHDADGRVLPGRLQGQAERAQGQPRGRADHRHHAQPARRRGRSARRREAPARRP